MSFDQVLSDLDGSEMQVYGEAFQSFGPSGAGYVGLDNDSCRRFLTTRSSLPEDELDMELLKSANPDEGLDLEVFLRLLRDHAVPEGEIYSQFAVHSRDGQSLPSEESRSGLFLFAQQYLAANINQDRWDCILNMVMMDAGASVSMEQWTQYCRLVARYVRLVAYLEL